MPNALITGLVGRYLKKHLLSWWFNFTWWHQKRSYVLLQVLRAGNLFFFFLLMLSELKSIAFPDA